MKEGGKGVKKHKIPALKEMKNLNIKTYNQEGVNSNNTLVSVCN